MTAPTHVTVSLLASVLLAKGIGVALIGVDVLAIIIGSLAPDFDSPNSTVSRPGTLLKRFLPWKFRRVLDDLGKGIARTLSMTLGHRGPLHWPIIGVVIVVSGVVSGKVWLMWFGWAYIWHILADFCTVSGVPLWGPFSTKPVKWSSLRTGSWVEKLLFIFLAAALVRIGFPMLPEENQRFILELIN